MLRVLRFVGAAVAAILILVLASIALDRVVVDVPASVRKLSFPTTRGECSNLKEGMSEADLFNRIDKTDRAPWQTLTGDTIEFQVRNDGTCKVQMDHISRRVVRAEFEATKPGGFDLSGADSYSDE